MARSTETAATWDFHDPSRPKHPGQEPGTEGGAEQSHLAECDVNTIMAKFQRDGLADHVVAVAGNYGDYTGAVDYHSALSQVREAQEMFMTLPSDLRTEFDNDPGAFLEFAETATEDELREKGLLPPETAAPPATASETPVEDVPPAPDPAA